MSRAEALCERLPQNHDSHTADAVFATAFRFETTQEWIRAISLYLKVAKSETVAREQRCNAAFRLGTVLQAAGDTDGALRWLPMALEAESIPVREQAVLLYLQLLAARRDWLGVAAHSKTPVESPHVRQILQLYRLLAGAFLYDANTLEMPDKLAEVGIAHLWMNAAVSSERTGYLEVARRLYERLLEAAELPTGMRGDVHYRLGLLYEQLVRWDEAERHLDAAMQSPEATSAAQIEARHRLGNLLFLADHLERALAVLDPLRSSSEASPALRAEARLKYATCLHRLGRNEEARSALSLPRETDASAAEYEIRSDLLLAEIAAATGMLQEALKCYRRVAEHPAADPLTRASALARSRDLSGTRP